VAGVAPLASNPCSYPSRTACRDKTNLGDATVGIVCLLK
jgi:hypothetical protein